MEQAHLAIFVVFEIECFAEAETENLHIWVCFTHRYTYVEVGVARVDRIKI